MVISYIESQKHNELHTYSHLQNFKGRGTVKETNKMETMKEAAQTYEPVQQTLNIAALDKFPIDIELLEGKGKNNDGEEFTYKYVSIDGQNYRVAGSVIGGLKALLGKMPNLKFVSVIKQGEGMNTRYQVIPFVEGD